MYLEYLAFEVENVRMKSEVYDSIHSSATFQAVKLKYKLDFIMFHFQSSRKLM